MVATVAHNFAKVALMMMERFTSKGGWLDATLIAIRFAVRLAPQRAQSWQITLRLPRRYIELTPTKSEQQPVQHGGLFPK
jgi:hypothetical protein